VKLRHFAKVAFGVASLALAGQRAPVARAATACPSEMTAIDGRYCIDRWEAALVVIGADGRELEPHSPFELLKEGERMRAISRRGIHPQAHISREQAEYACRNAGKRLCSKSEWVAACKGRQPTRYPYGNKHRPGYCNDAGVTPLGLLHGRSLGGLDWRAMNDRRLNQVPGTLARTGTYARCVNEYGVFDMVGNLHEWTNEASGSFRGGYYLDTTLLGEGCDYAADGHDRHYRDYSTGFRCCADVGR
jgi:formylglycine-generating enzyme required for sulfatase activity